MKAIGLVCAALVSGVALVGAACGGDDEASNGTDTTETETGTGSQTVPEGTALKGSVGPGFEISMTTEDGDGFTTLEAGSYELEIEDLASIHNFHLSGPAVDISTDVGEEGTQSFTLVVQPGQYSFVCDPHAVTMVGTFEVE
jgi:plastocyanin